MLEKFTELVDAGAVLLEGGEGGGRGSMFNLWGARQKFVKIINDSSLDKKKVHVKTFNNSSRENSLCENIELSNLIKSNEISQP